jgi:hypothetical protein
MKQQKQRGKKDLPYLYNPNVWVGENQIDGINKDFAQYCGFTNWQRCTNHSNRKLGVTTAVLNAKVGIQHIISTACCHKDANMQKRYFVESARTMQAFSRAVLGKHVPSPSKTPTKNPKKRRVIAQHLKTCAARLIALHPQTVSVKDYNTTTSPTNTTITSNEKLDSNTTTSAAIPHEEYSFQIIDPPSTVMEDTLMQPTKYHDEMSSEKK